MFGVRSRHDPKRGAALVAALASVVLVLVGGTAPTAADEPRAPATPEEIVAYRVSGEWARDTTDVTRRATEFLETHLNVTRPALVLDIDDTALSNYSCLKRVQFVRSRAGDRCASAGRLPAIRQTLELFRFARDRDVSVFFLTGRRERARWYSTRNLRREGYRGGWRLILRPDRERPGTHAGFKARTRAALERRGYTIVVNLGDQRSDLAGGHALGAYKLPNPMYVIPEA